MVPGGKGVNGGKKKSHFVVGVKKKNRGGVPQKARSST